MAKILVVEDDAFLREIYTEILTQDKHVVEVAEDGEVGFNKMKQGGYDLVLLDLILPKMNGIDIMNKLKTDAPLTPNKCVVCLTNQDREENIKQALQMGDGYLIKSQITPGDLLKEVKLYLSKFSAMA